MNVPKKNYYILHFLVAILVTLFFVILFSWINNLNLKSRELRKKGLSEKLSRIEESYQIGKLNDVTLRNYVEVYFNLAKLYLNEEDFDKAIALYKRGLQIDSWRQDKILDLGYAYKGKGLYGDAYERFNQVLSLKPDIFTWLRVKWEITALKKKIGNFKEKEEKIKLSEGRLKDLVIYMLPFGISDKEMLEDLRCLLQDTFKIRFFILNPLLGPVPGFDKERNQYLVEPLLEYVSQEYKSIFFIPRTQAILIVTSFDITGKDLNFIFGHSDAVLKLGIISYHRFLWDKPKHKLFFKRLLTQSLSTGGFLLGLPRCSSLGCARSYPHSFAEFKRKSHKLCRECQNNLNKILEKLKDCPEVDWSLEDLERLNNVKGKYSLD